MAVLHLALLLLCCSAVSSSTVSMLLQSGRVSEAVAAAKAQRRQLQHAGDAPAAFEWVRAHARVQRSLGTPLSGGAASSAVEVLSVGLPDGRTLGLHAPSARAIPSGLDVPLQGLVLDDTLYPDAQHAHECMPVQGGRAHACTIGGGPVREFASEAQASAAAAEERSAAGSAYLASLGLPSTSTSSSHPRALQLGAAQNNTLAQYSLHYSGGVRTLLAVRVKFFDPQYSSNTDNTSEVEFLAAYAALKSIHERRSFGALTLSLTLPPCVYNLSTRGFTGTDAVAAAFVAAAGSAGLPAACRFTPAQVAAFNHVSLSMPYGTADAFFAGLGNMPGRWSWMNGNLESGLQTLAHEFGHNYGLHHAATADWTGGYSEYGDTGDVMGSGFDMESADYNAGAKHVCGWMPSDRVVNIHPQPAGSSASSSGVFWLAASDRDYPAAGAGRRATAALPAGVALTARAAIPIRPALLALAPGLWSNSPSLLTSVPYYTYLTFRSRRTRGNKKCRAANAELPSNQLGVYLHDTWILGSGVPLPSTVWCHRDPTCSSPLPVAPWDAGLYDAGQSRLLVEVGPPLALFAEGGQQQGAAHPSHYPEVTNASALLTRLVPLDTHGLALDGSMPLGCTAAGCAALPEVRAIATTGAGAPIPLAFSPLAPVAVFSFTPPTDTVVLATACSSAPVPPLAQAQAQTPPLGLSAFIGPFPVAHAYYGGSVGISGDVNFPGALHPALWNYSAGACGSVQWGIAAGATAWLVAGSPGKWRGSALTGSITFTLTPNSAALTASTAEGVLGGIWAPSDLRFSRTALPCTHCAGQAVFVSSGDDRISAMLYLRYTEGTQHWEITEEAPWVTPARGPGTYATLGTLVRVQASDPSPEAALQGLCPSGSYSTASAAQGPGKNACTRCPLGSQVSTGAGSGRSAGLSSCVCPVGWAVNAGGTACTGPQAGGPLATPPTATALSCPPDYYLAPTDYASAPFAWPAPSTPCSPCPLGTAGQGCTVVKQYPYVEVLDHPTDRTASFRQVPCFQGIFSPNPSNFPLDFMPQAGGSFLGAAQYGPGPVACAGETVAEVQDRCLCLSTPGCSCSHMTPPFSATDLGWMPPRPINATAGRRVGYVLWVGSRPTSLRWSAFLYPSSANSGDADYLEFRVPSSVGSNPWLPEARGDLTLGMITQYSLNFCAPYDRNVDFAQRRVCYCGPGLYATAEGVCVSEGRAAPAMPTPRAHSHTHTHTHTLAA